MDKYTCISDCTFLPALLAQDHENCNAPALIAPSKGESAMRVLCSASSIGVCVLAVACCAVPAIGQSSPSVLPPVSTRVKAAPVQLGNATTSALQSNTAPFWTKLKNAPPVSVGAMLLLTDGRILVHEE